MINWSYCSKDIPEYEDLVALSHVINYTKRRLLTILDADADVFTQQEAINSYVKKLDDLSNEYRYMVLMHWPDGRLA